MSRIKTMSSLRLEWHWHLPADRSWHSPRTLDSTLIYHVRSYILSGWFTQFTTPHELCVILRSMLGAITVEEYASLRGFIHTRGLPRGSIKCSQALGLETTRAVPYRSHVAPSQSICEIFLDILAPHLNWDFLSPRLVRDQVQNWYDTFMMSRNKRTHLSRISSISKWGTPDPGLLDHSSMNTNLYTRVT